MPVSCGSSALEGLRHIGTRIPQFFIQPDFATLKRAQADSDGQIHRGLLTIGDRLGRIRSLQGRVWRVDRTAARACRVRYRGTGATLRYGARAQPRLRQRATRTRPDQSQAAAARGADRRRFADRSADGRRQSSPARTGAGHGGQPRRSLGREPLCIHGRPRSLQAGQRHVWTRGRRQGARVIR